MALIENAACYVADSGQQTGDVGGRGCRARVCSVAVLASRRPDDCFESQETVENRRGCRRCGVRLLPLSPPPPFFVLTLPTDP